MREFFEILLRAARAALVDVGSVGVELQSVDGQEAVYACVYGMERWEVHVVWMLVPPIEGVLWAPSDVPGAPGTYVDSSGLGLARLIWMPA